LPIQSETHIIYQELQTSAVESSQRGSSNKPLKIIKVLLSGYTVQIICENHTINKITDGQDHAYPLGDPKSRLEFIKF
jgi:hypothetical protein